MSLEDALNKNTAALEAHTAALNNFKGSASATATAAGTGKPAAATTKKNTAAKAPTVDDVKAAAQNFMALATTEEKKTEVKGKMRKLLDHFGVGKATEIAPASWADAIAGLELLTKGGTPEFMVEEEAAEEDDADAMV